VVQTAAYQIYPIGDQGITLDYGGEMSETVNRKIFQLYKLLKNWQSEAVLDVIPAYHSISIIYDLVKIKKIAGEHSAYKYVETKLIVTEALISDESSEFQGRKINIPVCYDQSLAPDLQELAALHQLKMEEIIEIHCSKIYRIYMIGFLPGFAYMGTVDERIASPRKSSPRINVPAGSVGIAGSQTGIYPFDSPGGWQLIGQTPLQLFDATKENPTLLEPGDQVSFHAISLEEFHHLKNKNS
jgi:inhibitor of KinA